MLREWWKLAFLQMSGMSYEKEVEFVYKNFREVLSLERSNKFDEAILLLTNLLPKIADPGLASETIAYRANIYERLGNYESAKKDLLYAISLIKGNNFSKYVLEIEIGSIYEKERNKKEALSWYQKALSTCIKAGDTSGDSAVRRFVRLKGESNLTKEERDLCEEAVRVSWKVLNLSGEPDLNDLIIIADYLTRVASDRTRYPSS